jgi:large subunit ribosomal protein L25
MYEVQAELREGKITKASTNELKRREMVPAVMYDRHTNSQHVAISRKEVGQLVQKRGTSGYIKLNINKSDNSTETHNVVFKNIQFDAFRNNIIHMDLIKTEEGVPVKIKVPIKGNGTPFGVLRQGGVLQQGSLETEIICKPEEIPDRIDVDVTDLKLSEVILARDLEGYTFTTPTQNLFMVASSRVARMMEASEDGEAGEGEESEEESAE